MSRSPVLSTLIGTLALVGLTSLTVPAQNPFRFEGRADIHPGTPCQNLPIVPAEPCAAAAVYAAHLRELQQQPVPPPGPAQDEYFAMLHCLEQAFHEQKRVCDEVTAAMPGSTPGYTPPPGAGDRPLPPDLSPRPPIRGLPDDFAKEPVGPIDVGEPGTPGFCSTPQLEELIKRPCQGVAILNQEIATLTRELPPPGTPMTGVQELRLRPLYERLNCLQKWSQHLTQLCGISSADPAIDLPKSFSRRPSPATPDNRPGVPVGSLSVPLPPMTVWQAPPCSDLVRQFQSLQQQQLTTAPRGTGLTLQRRQIELRLRQLCPEAMRVIYRN